MLIIDSDKLLSFDLDLDYQSVGLIVLSAIISIMVMGYMVLRSKHKQLEKEVSIKTNGIPVKDFSKMFPILGETDLFLNPIPYQLENHVKYGDIFATLFMNDIHIVINTSDLFDQVFIQNAKNIQNEWNDSFIKMFGEESTVIINGEKNKQQRKILFEFIGVPSLSRMYPRFLEYFTKTVDSWLERTKDGSYVDIVPEVHNAVWDAISFVIFGEDIDPKVHKQLRDLMVEFGYGIFAIPIDLPYTTFRRALDAKEKFRQIVVGEYNKRMALPDRGFSKKDLFQAMIEGTGDMGYKDGFNMDMAITVIWASVDTTKSAILRIIDTMIDHAREWDKIEQEITTAFGKEGLFAPDVNPTRLEKELPYMAACTKECIRFSGGALLSVRRVVNDFEVTHNNKKYTIAAGYKIYGSFHYNFKDPETKTYSDATSFIPERFIGDQAEDKISKNKSAFNLFGVGERYCPGNPIATLEQQLFISLMSKYKWTRRERVPEWKAMPTPTPINGLWIRGAPKKKN